MTNEPTTLQEAVLYFSDPDNCVNYLTIRRWPDGIVTCPTCGTDRVGYLKNVRRWQCSSHHDKRQFTLKTGTVMEDSAIGLDKWMVAIWLGLNCKNGISSYEVARALGVSQKSAWHMMHRVRFALHGGSEEKLSGHVEADETFIGGKARNMHIAQRKRRITGTGGKDKTAVIGILQRGKNGEPSKVRNVVIPNRRKHAIHGEVKKHVHAGSALYTDFLLSYEGLEGQYAHKVVDHAVEYVNGNVHTNSLENYWSLLKRTISGTYVSVEPYHLFRYLDEQAFRFNERTLTDGERFDMAVKMIVGKRLTWKALTGKNEGQPAI